MGRPVDSCNVEDQLSGEHGDQRPISGAELQVQTSRHLPPVLDIEGVGPVNNRGEGKAGVEVSNDELAVDGEEVVDRIPRLIEENCVGDREVLDQSEVEIANISCGEVSGLVNLEGGSLWRHSSRRGGHQDPTCHRREGQEDHNTC